MHLLKGDTNLIRGKLLNYTLQIVSTVEPLKTDSPYYGNLHNADKSPWSRIIPYTIVYVHKETSVLRTPPK